MACKTPRAHLALTDEQRSRFEKLAKSMTAPFRKRQRAQSLLAYADEHPISRIAAKTGASRKTVDESDRQSTRLGSGDRT